jgi:hypothetical protein
MFHEVIKNHPNGRALVKRYTGDEPLLFNYREGKIIAHLIRTLYKTQDARINTLKVRYRLEVSTVLDLQSLNRELDL